MLRQKMSIARSHIRRIATFGAVGLFNTLAFFVLANALNQLLGIGEAGAAYVSYAALVPVSFFGHRRLTFRSRGNISREWLKFCAIQVANLSIIWCVTILSQKFPFISGWPAFAIISVLIPVVSFFVMQIWVFSEKGLSSSVTTPRQ
jgi:putative flippase GtrA